MVGNLIHLNGAPGVGKLTIARFLCARLQARLLDNHAIYNVAFGLTEFQSPEFYEAVRAVRRAAYDQILKLPKSMTVVLTDAYFADSDWGWESWQAIKQLAASRQCRCFTISIICEAEEHRKRIVGGDRGARGKLQNPSYVEDIGVRPLIEQAGNDSLGLDVTHLAPDEDAARIAAWIATVLS